MAQYDHPFYIDYEPENTDCDSTQGDRWMSAGRAYMSRYGIREYEPMATDINDALRYIDDPSTSHHKKQDVISLVLLKLLEVKEGTELDSCLVVR